MAGKRNKRTKKDLSEERSSSAFSPSSPLASNSGLGANQNGARSSQGVAARTASERHRTLRFDRLESRELMAVVAALVYEDLDANGSMGADELPSPDQVVYFDTNSNQQFDLNEVFGVTDSFGRVTLQQNFSGDATLRLLRHSSRAQTNPQDNDTAIRLLATVDGDGVASLESTEQWGVRLSASLSVIDQGGGDFEQAQQLDRPVMWMSDEDPQLGRVSLLKLDPAQPAGTSTQLAVVSRDFRSHQIIPLSLAGQPNSVIELTSLSQTAAGWLAVGDVDGQRKLLAWVPGETSLVSQPISLSANARIATASQGNALAVIEPVLGPQGQVGPDESVRWYSREANGSWRSLPGQTISGGKVQIQFSPDGKLVIVQQGANEPQKFETFVDLAQGAPLVGTSFPFRFSSSGILVASTSTDRSSVIVQRASDSQLVRRWELPSGETIESVATEEYFAYARDLSRLAFLTSVGLREVSLWSPAGYQIPSDYQLEDGELSFGVLQVASNTPPDLQVDTIFSVDEDQWLEVGAEVLASYTIDQDGDRSYYVIEQGAAHGSVDFDADGRWSYRPESDYYGSDRFVVRAVDGRSASPPVTISVSVKGIDDLPTGVEINVPAIPENVAPGITLGTISVSDPDRDDVYRIEVVDSRLVVVGNSLQLRSGTQLNYETESTLVLAVRAYEVNNPSVIVDKTVTVSIVNQNDSPKDILLTKSPIAENEPRATVGRIDVVDEDQGDEFVYYVSDDRFEVFGNTLRLRPESTVNFEEGSQIPIRVWVTDQEGNGASLERSFVVDVEDRDDPSSLIQLSSSVVPEKVTGAIVGEISVVDEDAGQTFEFAVSDPRFVVQGRTLRLQNSVALTYEDTPSVMIAVTARSTNGSASPLTQPIKVQVKVNPRPWHNPVNGADVDDDGAVNPIDALIVINYLNRNGSHQLTDPIHGEGERRPTYIDVNGDGYISPIDALLIINQLNARHNETPLGGEGGGEGEGASRSSGGSTPTPTANPVPTPMIEVESDPIKRRKL